MIPTKPVGTGCTGQRQNKPPCPSAYFRTLLRQDPGGSHAAL